MNKLWVLLVSILLITSCSFKIPAGTYTTAPLPSSGNFAFAGLDLTLTDNGRFQYNQWSDDGSPLIGHGGYVKIGKSLFFLFENTKESKSGYVKRQITCTEQDSQIIHFKIKESDGNPIIGASIYNKDDHSQGLISQIDGTAQLTIPKISNNKVFVISYTGFETIEVEFSGDVCLDINITYNQKMDLLKLGQIKTARLKKNGDQLFIKMQSWDEYDEIYLRK